jgi:Uma2 family endonuclease
MTAEEYLVWESHQECRHEYIDGEIVAMTGGTVPHNDIAVNLLLVIGSHVRAQGCRINLADVKVPIPSTGNYFYPDLVVSCDERDRTAIKLIQFPLLIVEVLPPGTEGKDRGTKFKQYGTLSSLQEYVLIDSESISVECYRRGEGRMWLYSPYAEGDTIALASLGIEVAIAQLYENVQLNPEADEQHE